MKQSPEKQLVSTGVNSAGYPQYERRPAKPSWHKEPAPDAPDMNRRGFLKFLGKGAAAAAAMGTIPVLLEKEEDGSEHDNVPEASSQEVGELIEDFTEASAELLSDSAHFNHAVEALIEHYERDVPFVLEYGSKVTKGDELKRSRIEYVASMLTCDDVPESIMRELRTYIVGLCFEESRYDAGRISGKGAKGILQIVPATWNEHAREHANELSLVDQTVVAGKLFSQTHQYLRNVNEDG